MLTYLIYQRKDMSTKELKFYPRVKHDKKIVELEDLAEHMAGHNTPYSPGAILGILTDMVKCIRELTLEGKQVRLPNLAIFGLKVNSKGVADIKDFDITALVKRTKLSALATGTFRPSELKGKVTFSEADDYVSPRTLAKEEIGGTEPEPDTNMQD